MVSDILNILIFFTNWVQIKTQVKIWYPTQVFIKICNLNIFLLDSTSKSRYANIFDKLFLYIILNLFDLFFFKY